MIANKFSTRLRQTYNISIAMLQATLLLLFLISSCNGSISPSVETNTPFNQEGFSIDQYLQGTNGCVPPCWNGIIPGETNVGDALNRLEQMEESGEGQIVLVSDLFIRWEDNAGNSHSIRVLDDLVVRIEIPIEKTNSGAVIRQFDQPAAFRIDLGDHGPPHGLILYYPKYGMIILFSGLQIVDPNKIIEIPSELIAARAFFLQPSSSISSMVGIYVASYRGEEGTYSEPKIYEWE